MSDNSDSAFPTQLVVTCGFCGDINDIQWFCKWCAGSLCNSCKISHPSIPMFKNHIVVQRTNDVMRLHGPSKIAEPCRIHPEKELTTYCNDCQVSCCVTCQVQNHNRHDISSIEDKYLSAEKRLNDTVNELEKDVLPTLDNLAERTNNERSEKTIQISRVKEEVNIFRRDLKKAVDDSCDNLIEKLDQNDLEFDHFNAKIDAQKNKVLKMIKELNGIIQKGDLSMIKYSPPSPKTLIPDEPTMKLTIPIFTPRRDLLTNIKAKIGAIEWTVRNSKSNEAVHLLKKFDPAIIKTNKVMNFVSDINVTSITTAGNNTAWVICDVKDTMYQYDSRGNVLRSITLKDSNGINDMVIKRSGELITTCSDRKVRHVSVRGEVSTLIDTSPFEPVGICLTSKEEVVLCMRGQDKMNHVAMFSSDTTKKLSEIRGAGITDPYRVVHNGQGLCIVNVNLNPNNVVCIDEKFDLRWVYDGKGTKLSKHFIARGISVDKWNNLLINDYSNSCVHYIDRMGKLIQIILTKQQTGLTRPWGINVDDKTGRVWIGDSSKSVVICKYLK